MASIRLLSSGKYNVQVRIAGQKPISKTFNSHAEAKAFARQAEGTMAANRAILSNAESLRDPLADHLSVPFCTYIDKYLDEVSVKLKSHRTNLIRAKVLKRFIGGLSLRELTPRRIDQFMRERIGEGVSHSTCVRELAMISVIFNSIRKRWFVSCENPIGSIVKPKENKSRDRILKDDERERLLRVLADQPQLTAIVLLAEATAMRRGEIVGITWEHIDLAKKVLYLPDSKTGARYVPLSSKAVTVLERVREGKSHGRVFNISDSYLSHSFRAACKKARVDDFRFHDLRHSAITHYAQMGLTVMELQAISGHRTLQMLARYTHLQVDQLALKLG
jgi:integrase